MITTLIVMYVLIGLAVSFYEYHQSKIYLEEVKQYYPLVYRVIAVGFALACVTVSWPYTLYELFKESS